MPTNVETEFHLDGNGHETPDVLNDTEDQETLNTVHKKLREMSRGDGVLVSLTRNELSVIQKMLTVPQEFHEQQIWLIADFMDEDEAMDHVAAFYEAKELGMDTGQNVAYMLALAATNRGGRNVKNNRIAMLLDAFQHVKYTSNTPQKGKDGNYSSPRSPISG